MSNPKVSVGDWIEAGNSKIDAYVFNVFSPTEVAAGYYQNKIKAIKDDFVWDGESWQFKHEGPSGTYLKGSDADIVKRGPKW